MKDLLSQIHSDECLRLTEFPIAKSATYLAHAGVSPLPKSVAEAISKYSQSSQNADQETAMQMHFDGLKSARKRVASFLKVSENEVSLLGPTSNSLSVIAAGFPFERGDNVLIYRDDYPSNVYPWLALSEKGVEIRSVIPKALGLIQIEDVLKKIDGKTRLVALPSCHYLSGFRLDLDEIGSALQKRKIAFCVDGIQSLGAFEMNLEFVDFMAAGSHKWMLGPCGMGILFVSETWQDRLRATSWGWNNVACPDFIAADSLKYVSGARRFEAGTPNWMGLIGLISAIELLDSFGISAIEKAISDKRSLLFEGVRQAGYEMIVPSFSKVSQSSKASISQRSENSISETSNISTISKTSFSQVSQTSKIPKTSEKDWGGILSFRHPKHSLVKASSRLNEAGVRFSFRKTRNGNQWIRLSPHFYNSTEELKLAISCL